LAASQWRRKEYRPRYHQNTWGGGMSNSPAEQTALPVIAWQLGDGGYSYISHYDKMNARPGFVADYIKPLCDHTEAVAKIDHFEGMWKASVQDWKDEQAKVAELVREVAELEATQRKFGTLQHELLTRAETAEARAAALRSVLRVLVEQDPVDLALDPNWSQRIAKGGLDATRT